MGLPDLYPAQVGSPWTTLAAPYTTGGATMTVVDATKLPDAPNIVCLAGDVAGEFSYTGKEGNVLQGVTALPGTPVATTWPAGTFAFRGISAYDHASIVEHLTYLRSHIVEATLDLTTNHTYSGRVLEGAEAGENLAFGDLAVLAESGKFVKANPATLGTLDGTIALVVSDTIAAGSQGMFLLRGLIRNDSWTFSPGKELYASNGTLTHEPPTTGTQIIRKVGTALTATIIEFNPSSTLHAEYLVSVLPVNTVSKDNGDVERKFWKDDFNVDTKELYDVTGTVTGWGTGVITLPKWVPVKVIINNREFTDSKISFCLENIDWTITGAILVCVGMQDFNNTYAYYIISNETTLVASVLRKNNAVVTFLANNLIIPKSGTQRFECVKTGKHFTITCDGYTYSTSDTEDYYPVGKIGFDKEMNIGLNISDLSITPSESYADDFATDTTERYQPVLGTVAYDDTNKRMNVTTATGANGKASGRLKSYKFCEGAQQFDVTLPTGADGDFICLVTHSANGLMTDGIGVGLRSDGEGNWNLVTLSGTTVTVGALSGLTDGKTARIEIEKDITGAYWYYIYDAAGTKPTTATGKLFTALSEGYTGWYANGAGATTQTYAIENISIRAESIMGRTNVEVTEPFWFRDEFGENSIGRYIIKSSGGMGSSDYKIEDGYFKITRPGASMSGWMYYPTRLRPTRISGIVKRESTTAFSSEPLIFFNISGTWHHINDRVPAYGYGLRISGTSIALLKYDSGDNDGVVIGEYMTTVPKDIDFEYEISITDGMISVKWDTVENAIEVNDSTYTDGYVGLACWSGNAYCDFAAFKHIEISGTRVYNKPIHRGAMLESYHDGTQKVVGTTFIDDCQWDRSAEYEVASVTRSTTNGTVTLTNANSAQISKIRMGYGIYIFDIKPFVRQTQPKSGIVIGRNISAATFTNNYLDGTYYLIEAGRYGYQPTYLKKVVNGVETRISSSEIVITHDLRRYWIVLWEPGSIKIYVAERLTDTWTLLISSTDNSITEGYFGVMNGLATSNIVLYGTQIIAASPDTTNGIAACIPPIGGGARYGVEESVYIPITPGTEIPVGTAVISPNAKSTVVGTALTTFAQTPAGVSASLEYATGTKACPSLSTAFAPAGRHRVKADRNTLTNIGVKGSVAGTSPTVYIDSIDSLHVRRQEVA